MSDSITRPARVRHE